MERGPRHERLHRTLKAETTRPPASSRRSHEHASRAGASTTTMGVPTKPCASACPRRPIAPHRGRFLSVSAGPNTRFKRRTQSPLGGNHLTCAVQRTGRHVSFVKIQPNVVHRASEVEVARTN